MYPKIMYEYVQYPLDEHGVAVAELGRQLHRDHLDPNAREFFSDTSKVARALLVAVVGNETAGYVSVERVYGEDTEMWLKWIVVHTDHRRGGLGTSLIRELTARARAEGVTRLMLEPWHENKSELEDWYTGLGFRWLRDQDSVPSDYLVLDI